ncbi:MAG: TonB family protein [Bacteroidales bacterium]|nr:TonB family protein [Bacteroidales bacterium]
MENNSNTIRYDNYISMDDIVFEGRNKEYGAYYLRKRYSRYLVIAFFIAFIGICAAMISPVIAAYQTKHKVAKKYEKEVVMEMEKLEDNFTPPPPPPPPPEVEAQAKFTAPVVVDTVKQEVRIATIDEVKEVVAEAPPEEIKIDEEKVTEEIQEEDEPPFIIVEENATFKGGDVNSFRSWVQQNIVYPPIAAEAGISGKVFVQFCVNSKGQVCDVKVLRGVHPELDKEVIRCINSSPAWIPAKQGGKAVKQQFVMPIMFQLQGT